MTTEVTVGGQARAVVIIDDAGTLRLHCPTCRQPYRPLHRRDKAGSIMLGERCVWACGFRCLPAIADQDFRQLARLAHRAHDANVAETTRHVPSVTPCSSPRARP